jgi:adenylosuccinate synthase
MVLDLDVLFDEIVGLKSRGFDPQLFIDARAHVIMPWHIDLDAANEIKSGKHAAGSTGRGIAPAYASKHERSGVRVRDFFDNPRLVESLVERYAERVAFEAQRNYKGWYVDEYAGKIQHTRERVGSLRDCLCDVTVKIYDELSSGEHILGECAQAEMLDVDSPFYPYGTSSSTTAVGFWNGIGIHPLPKFMGPVTGVVKAYTTRVGNGPFLTELPEDIAHVIRERGGEYGTTTKRARRIGSLDIPMIRQGLIPSGVTGLAVTKLDIFGGMGDIRVAKHYEGGDFVPVLGYGDVQPCYSSMEAWPEFTEAEYRSQLERGISGIKDYPLRAYLEMIQEEVGVPITMVCFGQSSSAFLSYR